MPPGQCLTLQTCPERCPMVPQKGWSRTPPDIFPPAWLVQCHSGSGPGWASKAPRAAVREWQRGYGGSLGVDTTYFKPTASSWAWLVVVVTLIKSTTAHIPEGESTMCSMVNDARQPPHNSSKNGDWSKQVAAGKTSTFTHRMNTQTSLCHHPLNFEMLFRMLKLHLCAAGYRGWVGDLKPGLHPQSVLCKLQMR